METVPEVDESKETSSIGAPGSPLPQNITAPSAVTSSSCSTTSPNSVKSNHVLQHPREHSQPQIPNISNTIQSNSLPVPSLDNNTQPSSNNTIEIVKHVDKVVETVSNDNSNNIINSTTISDSEKDDETPLLDGKNSTNINTNEFSGSEKDALINNSSNN